MNGSSDEYILRFSHMTPQGVLVAQLIPWSGVQSVLIPIPIPIPIHRNTSSLRNLEDTGMELTVPDEKNRTRRPRTIIVGPHPRRVLFFATALVLVFSFIIPGTTPTASKCYSPRTVDLFNGVGNSPPERLSPMMASGPTLPP